MKEPGGIPVGTMPGSEMTDPGVKARFYKLLAGYYTDETAARPDTGQLGKIENLMEDEAVFASECGGK
jgi:hypothetical protein